jgi:hypothetical protein
MPSNRVDAFGAGNGVARPTPPASCTRLTTTSLTPTCSDRHRPRNCGGGVRSVRTKGAPARKAASAASTAAHMALPRDERQRAAEHSPPRR